MSFLGICPQSGAIYEGSSSHGGFRAQPAPFLTPIRFVVDGKIPQLFRTATLPAEMLFREFDFDAITRIRRGYVYTRRNQSQPWGWYVQDPFRQDLPRVGIGGNAGTASAQEISLITYQTDPLNELAMQSVAPLPRVILGWEPYATYWIIVSIEHSAESIPLITLRAHHSLSELPELNLSRIPEPAQKPITEALHKLGASMNRLSPTEVVDRCRDALSIVFGIVAGDMTKDLGSAISSYSAANKEDLRSWAGRIVARMHARGKPNEQHARASRSLSDDDSLLAVRCVRLVLTEFEWTA